MRAAKIPNENGNNLRKRENTRVGGVYKRWRVSERKREYYKSVT